MAEEVGMPALNFTALLDDAQAAARNGLSSGVEETAATPGQRREGSRALGQNLHDIQQASPAAETSASPRPALQPRERQFDQRGAPPRVANGLHDIAAIMQGGNERPIELDWRQEEYAVPRAPAPAHGFPPPPAHDRPYTPYVAPSWQAGRGPNAPQVHLVDQHFVPAAFLLEFQGVIRNVVATV